MSDSRVQYVALLIILALSEVTFAQDLIVTTKGDSINCEITRKGQDFVYFIYKDEDKVFKTVLPADEITFSKKDYFKTSEVAGSSSYRRETFKRLRLGFGGGWGYRTARIAGGLNSAYRDHYKDMKSGYHIDAVAVYYFTEPLGMGVRYNRFLSNVQSAGLVDKVTIDFVGPLFSTRLLNGNNRNALLLEMAIGYIDFKDITTGNTIRGKSFGTSLGVGYDIALSDKIALGLQASFQSGTITSIEITQGAYTSTQKLDKQNYESLSHLDLGVGLRLSL